MGRAIGIIGSWRSISGRSRRRWKSFTRKEFPAEERFSLTDQVRRSSRSVCANLAEAWRKRRYEAAFVSKLSDAEAEAAESQVWIEFAVECGYLSAARARLLYARYNLIIGTIVGMITHTD